MFKLLNSTAFYEQDEPSVTILDLSKPERGLEKKAAHEEIAAYLAELQPKPGHTYLHINAMTAGEYHGSNRNADFFPEENLKRYYKTFETTPAYVYRSHINKDPARSYGKVIFSIYNERMHRVELICECPDDLVEDINSRVQKGDFPTTSMACKTPADTCSICGNRATSRQAYCSHLKTELNRLYPDGRKVFAINDQPLTFFDISIVVRPADVNSSVLQKIAYSPGQDSVLGSAELAEMEGVGGRPFYKRAAMRKFSELVKEINDGCYVVGAEREPTDLLEKARVGELPLDLASSLGHLDITEVLNSMADLGISPSVAFLAELIAHNKLGPGFEGIGPIVEDLVAAIPPDYEVPNIKFKDSEESSALAKKALAPYVSSASLLSGEVEKRASNIGYAGNGPWVEPSHTDAQYIGVQERFDRHLSEGPELTQLLAGLGSAALMAKYYITARIEKRLVSTSGHSQNGVKIMVVKQASDYRVAARLAKLAMVQSLPSSDHKQTNPYMGPAKTGLSAARYALSSTKTAIGGKLMGLLKAVSFGLKVNNQVNS